MSNNDESVFDYEDDGESSSLARSYRNSYATKLAFVSPLRIMDG